MAEPNDAIAAAADESIASISSIPSSLSAATGTSNPDITALSNQASAASLFDAETDPEAPATAPRPAPTATEATAPAPGQPLSELDKSVHQSALSSSSAGLLLYDLTNAAPSTAGGSQKSFSPHCIKTILDLKLLDVGYERQKLTFTQIRGELSQKLDENVTVPTLELSDGSHLTDSWAIAQYLSKSHPKGSQLFPSAASRPLAAFLNNFAKLHLAPNLGPLCRPGIFSILEPESARYFEEDKVGKAKLERERLLSSDDKELLAAKAKNALESVGVAIEENGSEGKSPFIEGLDHPTHADFVVFGWYVYSLACKPKSLVREIWHENARVSRWVEALRQWSGDEVNNFVA